MSAQLGAAARRKGFGFSRNEGVGGKPCAMLALVGGLYRAPYFQRNSYPFYLRF